MKYLCLGYLNTALFGSLSEAEKNETISQYPAHCVTMRATGKVIAAAGLERTSSA
jgi:hypothetical protein